MEAWRVEVFVSVFRMPLECFDNWSLTYRHIHTFWAQNFPSSLKTHSQIFIFLNRSTSLIVLHFVFVLQMLLRRLKHFERMYFRAHSGILFTKQTIIAHHSTLFSNFARDIHTFITSRARTRNNYQPNTNVHNTYNYFAAMVAVNSPQIDRREFCLLAPRTA